MKHATCYQREGRDSEDCREASERVMQGPWGWVLLVVMSFLWAAAQVGFA